jgi:hypothetical protein
MHRFVPARALAAAALAGGLFAASAASAQPDATIHFSGGSVAFIGQVQWGGGTLHFHGRSVPLRVNGIGVGAIGATSFSAEGDVYHLHHLHDIVGTYSALNTNATAGAGAGEIDMQNEHGVEIRSHSSSAGLNLSLAPTGMHIDIK